MYRTWTSEQEELLKQNYADTPNTELAALLGKKSGSINAKAHVMGLRKSKVYMDKYCNLAENGKRYQFTKGHKPANTGIKMSEALKEKLQPTMFKKGTVPPNAKPHINEVRRGCGYWYTRHKGKWLPKHQKIWAEANGPQPPGHVVAFKDGNKDHCVLENLELISRRENANRNRLSQYPAEMQEVIKIKNRIIKKIKEHEK